MVERNEIQLSPLLIALASILWATDTPFRLPAVQALDPVWVVLFEHFVGLASLLVWAVVKKRKEVFQLRLADWIGAILVGGGGSAMATVFFTASFRLINPSLTILLQKLQPILVILLASLFLKEKPKKGFFPWAFLALGSAVILSFPDFNFTFLKEGIDLHSRGVLYAVGAAILWAIATISGKFLLRKNAPGTVTFWRYSFGFCTLLGITLLSHFSWATPAAFSTLASSSVLKSLLYISIVPGILSMVAYYAGLLRTPASSATLIELLYPVSAVLINTLILELPLNPIQLGAGTILLIAVLKISWDSQKSQ